MGGKLVSDYEFLLLCLKNSAQKPDFEAVAAQLGCHKTQAYHRHYHLMKACPTMESGELVDADGDPFTTASPASTAPKSAGRRKVAIPRPFKRAIKTEEEDDDDDLDLDVADVTTPTKKAKKSE